MRSSLIFTALLAISTWFVQVEGAACAAICYTAELTGFGPGGTPGCTCSGSQQGARTGAGECNCGQCYDKTQGVVYGYALNADGTCTYGTDCGNCDFSSSSASSSTAKPTQTLTNTPTSTPITTSSSTPTPTQTTTTSPVSTTSAPSSTAVHSSSSSTSSIDSASASSRASTDSSNSSSKDNVGNSTSSQADSEAQGKVVSTWQIVLAICCLALIFLVAVVSVCACYCKARSRLYEHEDNHTSYYNQHLTFQPWTANNVPVATKSVNIV